MGSIEIGRKCESCGGPLSNYNLKNNHQICGKCWHEVWEDPTPDPFFDTMPAGGGSADDYE